SQVSGTETIGHFGPDLAVAPSEIATGRGAGADERLEGILGCLSRKLGGNELGNERVDTLPLAGSLAGQASPQFIREMHGHDHNSRVEPQRIASGLIFNVPAPADHRGGRPSCRRPGGPWRGRRGRRWPEWWWRWRGRGARSPPGRGRRRRGGGWRRSGGGRAGGWCPGRPSSAGGGRGRGRRGGAATAPGPGRP